MISGICRFPGTRYFSTTSLESITLLFGEHTPFQATISLCKASSCSWIAYSSFTPSIMDSSATAESPSLPWRALSNTTMWGVAGLCRGFLSVFCHAECHGKEAFTELLDSRHDVSQRTRGLITGMPDTTKFIRPVQLLTNSSENSIQSHQCVCASNHLGSNNPYSKM